MATVNLCDRCGRVCHTHTVRELDLEKPMVIDYITLVDKEAHLQKKYDLCDFCLDDFFRWFDTKENAV